MMKGRKPKLVAILEMEKGKLHGNQLDRAKRNEIIQKKPIPRCPTRLNAGTRREWKRIAKILKNYDLFSDANQILIDTLALNNWIVWECYEHIKDGDFISITDKGSDQYNSYLAVMNKAQMIVLKCTSSLGLSSSDIIRVTHGKMNVEEKMKSKMRELID